MASDPRRSRPDMPGRGTLEGALVGELMAEDLQRRPGTDHPALETLIAYRTDRLESSERTAVQAHLGGCADCVRTLRDLAAFLATAEAATDDAADLEAIASWRRLRPALREQFDEGNGALAAAGSAVEAAPATAPERAARYWPGLARAAAAVLAVTTGALLVQTVRLDGRLAQYEQPSTDVALLYIESGTQRGVGAGAQRYDVPARSPSFVLMIESPDLPASGSLEIEIANDQGEAVWKGRGSPGELGALRVSVPRSFLPAGAYWILVSATAQATPAPRAATGPLVRERIEIRYR